MISRNLRRAYRSGVFQDLADRTRKLRIELESGESALLKKVEYDLDSGKGLKDYEQQLSNFYLFNAAIEVVAEKLYAVAKSRKPDLYLMGSWLCTVIITAIIYAFEYFALYKMDSSSFKTDHTMTFWSFFGFSFGKFTPSSISTINPVSRLAESLSYSELFCTLLILVILVFSVLTAAREKNKEDIADFIEEVRSLGNVLQKQFTQMYNIALDDVERALIRSNTVLIKWVRKARGLPQLPLPNTNNSADAKT